MKVVAPAINPAQAQGLPAVYVQKITLLPVDPMTNIQKVKVHLSLQVACPPTDPAIQAAKKVFANSYRIFAAFSREVEPLMMLKYDSRAARMMIKESGVGVEQLMKHYLLPPPDGQKPKTITMRNPNVTVISKELVLKESIEITENNSLYFYAVAYGTDPDSIQESGVEGKIRGMRVGIPTCEIILRNGATPSQTAAFKVAGRKDTMLWPGPVHYHPDMGYMAGAAHTSAQHPTLSPILGSNQKVQDLRFIEAVNQLDFTLSDNLKPESLLVESIPRNGPSVSPAARRDAAAVTRIIQTPRYISDSSYSRMQDNSLKIFFSIDYGRLAKENSTLGYLIQNSAALYSSYSIENIKIYRTRINANVEPNKLTPGKVDICGSSVKKPNEEEKLVATLGNGVQTLGFRNLSGDILALAVTDSTMANYNFGVYEYRAVIETIDHTTSAIKNILTRLESSLDQYELLYNKMAGLGAKRRGLANASPVEPASRRAANPAWKDLIGLYLAAVEFIFGTGAMTPDPDVWRKNLVAMANPRNRDLESMLKVKEIVGDFVTNLRMISGPPTQPTSDGGSNVRSKIDSQNSATRKILLSHVFRSNYTSSGPPSEGTDYLDATLTARNGPLVSMGYQKFIDRVQMELSKFTLPRPNDPGVNQFGFLTPVRLNTQGSVVETNTVNLASSLGSGILASSLDSNSPSRPPTAPNSSDAVYFNDLNNILLSAGISVEQTTLPLGAVLRSRGKDVDVNTQASSKFLSDSSPFAKDDSELKTTLSGSNEFKMNISKEITENVLQSGIVEHLVNMRAINFIPPTDYMPPDNATGCLSAESAAQNPDSLDENSAFGQSINFNSVAEIQYFHGYVQTGTVINLNSPIWRTLTREVYLDAKSQNVPLLCRVVVMTPSLNMPNNYKLPLYDELFLLGPAARATSQLNVKGVQYPAFFKSLAKGNTGAASALLSDPLSGISPAYVHVPLETALNAPLAVGTQSSPGTRTRTTGTGINTGGNY